MIIFHALDFINQWMRRGITGSIESPKKAAKCHAPLHTSIDMRPDSGSTDTWLPYFSLTYVNGCQASATVPGRGFKGRQTGPTRSRNLAYVNRYEVGLHFESRHAKQAQDENQICKQMSQDDVRFWMQRSHGLFQISKQASKEVRLLRKQISQTKKNNNSRHGKHRPTGVATICQ